MKDPRDGLFSHWKTLYDTPLTSACGKAEVVFLDPALSVNTSLPFGSVYVFGTSTTRQDPDDPGLLAKVGG